MFESLRKYWTDATKVFGLPYHAGEGEEPDKVFKIVISSQQLGKLEEIVKKSGSSDMKNTVNRALTLYMQLTDRYMPLGEIHVLKDGNHHVIDVSGLFGEKLRIPDTVEELLKYITQEDNPT